MNVLIWHVHGSWTTAFVQGAHDYLLPVVPSRDGDGRGRARTWTWPGSAREVEPALLAEQPVDVVVLQRERDEHLANEWLGGRRVGRDIPAIWLEHNAPQGEINAMVHPAADRDDVVLVHVTHTNALFWDSGTTRTCVIEHGVIDPGDRYTGRVPRAAAAVNEPARRRRVVGADLLVRLARTTPVDLFGMATSCFATNAVDLQLRAFEDLPQIALHRELADRRVYVHPFRWTSLGLSLVEAMHLGMPVVALATTDVPDVVPHNAGFVTNRFDTFHAAIRRLLDEPEEAKAMGAHARRAALNRFGLQRFLSDWDRVFEEVVR
jgi:hypothetical protein